MARSARLHICAVWSGPHPCLSVYSIVVSNSVSGHWRLWPDCADVLADHGLCYSYMAEKPFSCISQQMKINFGKVLWSRLFHELLEAKTQCRVHIRVFNWPQSAQGLYCPQSAQVFIVLSLFRDFAGYSLLRFFLPNTLFNWTYYKYGYGLALLAKFSADNILKYFFLIFPWKQVLTFYANCLQWRQFAWNVKTCFLGKISMCLLK